MLLTSNGLEWEDAERIHTATFPVTRASSHTSVRLQIPIIFGREVYEAIILWSIRPLVFGLLDCCGNDFGCL
jgi:hypothetical protein